MYRRKSFDDKLSKKLRNHKFAKKYILDSIKKGKNVMDALKYTISCMGTKEFSEISGIKSPNISRMLSQNAIPKIATLQKFLDPFRLEAVFKIEPKRKSSKVSSSTRKKKHKKASKSSVKPNQSAKSRKLKKKAKKKKSKKILRKKR